MTNSTLSAIYGQCVWHMVCTT